jgi:hypothetical protein
MQFALEIGLRHEIKESASALRQEMSDMKFEFLKWLIGLAIAQVGLLIGLLKFSQSVRKRRRPRIYPRA